MTDYIITKIEIIPALGGIKLIKTLEDGSTNNTYSTYYAYEVFRDAEKFKTYISELLFQTERKAE